MALWLVRAGKHGQYESKFLDEGRVYLTWGGLDQDLAKIDSKDSLKVLLADVYPNASAGRRKNHAGQIWAFAARIKKNDWIALPSKKKAVIHLGECKGDYVFDSLMHDPFRHFREINWFATDVPRSSFDQDTLYSFGAFLTICQIKRNNAEERVRNLASAGWKPSTISVVTDNSLGDDADDVGIPSDLEQLARDQIAKQIIAKLKGHGMAQLVEAILVAQGYTTWVSPPGPDGGVDILAAPGTMGFGSPRICVQVKSSEKPVDLPTMNQLLGTMQNVHAEQGLLVSWGGFKGSFDKERASQFFRVRLWDQYDLIEQMLSHYDQLDEELRAEIPLKRMWTLAIPDDLSDDGD